MADRTGSRGGTIHSLEEARDLQTTGKPAEQWSTVIRTAIIETLLEHGEYHADDLIPLGLPESACQSIGAQVGALVTKDYIVEVGRRRAAAAASHGRKSGVYKFTDLGKRTFTGVDAGGGDGNSPTAPGTPGSSSVDPGDRTCTRPAGGSRRHSEPTPAGAPHSPAGPGSPREAATESSSEPLRLFEDTDQDDRKAAA